MKIRFFTFLLITGLLVSACAETEKSYYIGVSQCSNDAWRSKMNAEILRESVFYDGVEVEFRFANDDNERQISDIEYFAKKVVDLLIVAPNEVEAITPALEKVFDAGTPVVVTDRKILSEKYTAFLGGDNLQIGKDVGSYIAKILAGKGKVVELAGLKGSTPSILRHEGFISALQEYPDIEIETVYTDWTQADAFHAMDSLLQSGIRPDLVYAHNDRMAASALKASRERNVNDIFFVGVDALSGDNGGVDMVIKGDMLATFIYPTHGDKLMQTAMNILNGEKYERETLLPAPLVDKTNARIVKLQAEQLDEQDEKIERLNGMIGTYLEKYSNQQMVLYSFIIIIVLVIAILFIFIKANLEGRKMNGMLSRQNHELEEQRDRMLVLTKQLEDATQAKLVFFTNVSHDFRTPLTLIADPVENLLNDEGLNDRQKYMLDLVHRNVKILLRLVNQILDFRTYENGKMALSLSYVDIKSQVEEWVTNFQSHAIKKHINFSYEVALGGDYSMDLDLEKIERVFFNLVSNAFKFTPENGHIAVKLSHKFTEDGGETLVLAIKDDGQGISPGHITHIFDRFYKMDVMHSSSGIGLALTKAFVELHGGTLSVESEVGKGSVFSVEIPVKRELKDQEKEISESHTDMIETMEVAGNNDVTVQTADEKATILVIDDSRDVRGYISSILSDEYNVIEAEDGRQGLQKAMKHVPDAIICDVMMPVMDGLECCRRLKSEMQTSHIPVMMLTGCAMDEQRISGYECGADSYISKPFSSRLLLVRLKNLMNNYQRLKEFFGDGTTLVKESVSDMDKVFIDRFREIIEQNIPNSNVSVEDLGEELGLGRVQLYRKVKALTNYSPVELMRIARLKHAVSLLSSSDKTISEVAYDSGFTSPSYFTKCYKDYYGESPSELLARIGRKTNR